jgi:hypothetical protein
MRPDLSLRYSYKKQRAKFSLSSLPIGDTPVLIFSAGSGNILYQSFSIECTKKGTLPRRGADLHAQQMRQIYNNRK